MTENQAPKNPQAPNMPTNPAPAPTPQWASPPRYGRLRRPVAKLSGPDDHVTAQADLASGAQSWSAECRCAALRLNLRTRRRAFGLCRKNRQARRCRQDFPR